MSLNKNLNILSIALTGALLIGCAAHEYNPGVTNKTPIMVSNAFDIGNKEQKKTIAEKIWASPGNFNPAELIRAAAYFNSIKDYDKGTQLLTGAFLRARIDVEASKDRSLSDVPAVLGILGQKISKDLGVDLAKNYQDGLPYYLKSMENVLLWDGKTPRNYDYHWADAHSINNFLPQSAQVQKREISNADYQAAIKKIHAQYIETSQKEGIKIKPFHFTK